VQGSIEGVNELDGIGRIPLLAKEGIVRLIHTLRRFVQTFHRREIIRFPN
jgi:hypothetical protein